MRMTCNSVKFHLYETHSHYHGVIFVYVCNCNGIRERQALQVIESGASTVRAVFDGCDARAQCAKCVCDIRDLIDQAVCAMAIAAE